MCNRLGSACSKKVNIRVIWVCTQIKELVDIRDRYVDRKINRRECSEIIECIFYV